MKKFYVGMCAATACCLALALTACDNSTPPETKSPEKLKDGESFSITVGESRDFDLAQYISLADTEYAYVVSSDNKGVLTVKLEETTATVTAVSHGNAVVTATAGDISITFAAAVNAVPPVFENAAVSYDLYTHERAEIELAPKSGESTYSYTYALKTPDESVTITGDKLVAAYTAATQKTLTVVATYSDSAVTGAAPRTVEFDVAVNVVDTAPAAPVFDDRSIEYDVRTEASKEITLAPKSGESTYRYTYALKTPDENITITGDKLVAAYTQAAQKTLTVVATYTDSANAAARPRSVEFAVEIDVVNTTPTVKSSVFEKTIDIYDVPDDVYDAENGTLYLDLAENIVNSGDLPLTYRAVLTEADDQIFEPESGSAIVLPADGEFTPEGVTAEMLVTAKYGDGADEKIEYTYKITVKDTSVCRVANGGFASGLDGWTMTGDIGEISEDPAYWSGLPMHNTGKYFRGDGKESNVGTLASPIFTVGGINKISFKLGAAGNPDCFVTLEDEQNNVLRIWRNHKFADTGDGNADKVGTEKFILNLVTYVADLSDYEGQRVKIVLHDDATGGFGFFAFDELVTYYAAETDLPAAEKQDGRPVFAAINELADMTALDAALDGAMTEQGDYTSESFNAYSEKVQIAQAVAAKFSSTQSVVNSALEELNAARAALAVRVPAEKTNAEKSFKIFAGDGRTIALADYVNENELTSITYSVGSADDTKVACVYNAENGEVALSVPAELTGSHAVAIAIEVMYKGEVKLTVTLTVTATNEAAATLKNDDGITESIDLFDDDVVDKSAITLDFAKNIDNPRNIPLSYAVTKNGEPVTLGDGSKYSLACETYTETATVYTFAVTVSFTIDGEEKSISYDYVLNMTDTRGYRIQNGGFDNGLDGWTLVNGNDELPIGTVNNRTTYWGKDKAFNADGNFFNAYVNDKTVDGVTFSEGGHEGEKGTLTSSPFTIGGSGWITYKLGGAKNPDQVYMAVVDFETNEILAKFYNNIGYIEGNSKDCTLVAYKADLSKFKGRKVFIRLVDDAVGDYGLFFADSFATYHTQAPTGEYALAADCKYQVANGSFETGNIVGWKHDGNIGFVSGANGYWGDDGKNIPELLYQKDGNFFFEGIEGKVADGEGNRIGALTSSKFKLGGSGYITFQMGGAKHQDEQYIEVVDASDNTVLGRYSNTKFVDAGNAGVDGDPNKVSALTLNKYKADLSAFVGREVYIRIVDNHVGGDFGMIMFDNAVTYYESADSIGSDYALAANKV